MKKIWVIVQNSLDRTSSSIAFIPAIFAISGLLLSYFTITIEYTPFIIDFKKKIDFLLITSQEEGRLVLGTLVGSIISLMVFSFSMVMIVLNRASSSLSPRVLPGLISNKAHQVVLGFYLGTILYSLIMIINFQEDAEFVFPSLGILLAMSFGITCLCLFIYFIHSISKDIQVENIIYNIFYSTMAFMKDNEPEVNQSLSLVPSTDSWNTIKVAHAGYIKQIISKRLIKICVKHDLQIEIQKHIGFFCVPDYPLLKVNSSKELEEKTIDEINSCFIFYPADQVKDHYLFGFKQISEIATKALSPGINDPGTAIKALDLLSVLFIERMSMKEYLYEQDENGKVRVIYTSVSVEELIFQNLIPIREYGIGDVLVVLKLLEVLKNMLFADLKLKTCTKVWIQTIKSCIQAADNSIENLLDREQVNVLLRKINEVLSIEDKVSFLSNERT